MHTSDLCFFKLRTERAPLVSRDEDILSGHCYLLGSVVVDSYFSSGASVFQSGIK